MSQSQRRSLRNVLVTSQFHWVYMGAQVLSSLSLLLLSYSLILFHLSQMAHSGVDLPFPLVAGGVTLAACVVAVTIVSLAILSAHRIAGVHIKLQGAFERVEKGDFSTRIRFRTSDKLQTLEETFNRMMGVIEERVGTEEPASAETETETED
jgi:methyl-accepting chemotaxis protein